MAIPSYLYGVIVGDGKARAIKVNLDTFSLLTSLELNPLAVISAHCVIDSTYMYVTYGIGDSFEVIRVRLSDMTLVDSITISDPYEIPLCMLVHKGFLYVGCDDKVTSYIVKINLSTFVFDSALAIGVTGVASSPYDMVVVGNYLYTASQGYTYKIDLATFTEVGSIDWSVDYDISADLRCCCADSTYLYLGAWNAVVILRVALATFTWEETGYCEVTEDEMTALAISGGYLYATTLDGSPDLMKVDLTTFTEEDTLDVTYYDARDLVISGGYLYMAMDYTPGSPIIDKVRLSTFAQDTALDLEDYANYATWSIAGIVAGRKYLGNINVDQLVFQHAERMR